MLVAKKHRLKSKQVIDSDLRVYKVSTLLTMDGFAPQLQLKRIQVEKNQCVKTIPSFQTLYTRALSNF